MYVNGPFLGFQLDLFVHSRDCLRFCACCACNCERDRNLDCDSHPNSSMMLELSSVRGCVIISFFFYPSNLIQSSIEGSDLNAIALDQGEMGREREREKKK